jgi:hypothetical protein
MLFKTRTKIYEFNLIMRTCVLCNSNIALAKSLDFTKFKEVTSDCRPWKGSGRILFFRSFGFVQRPRTKKWFDECQSIYSSYKAHRQGRESEQKYFDGKVWGESRSEVLLKNIFEFLRSEMKNHISNWLDFGCGEGRVQQYLIFLRNK